MSRRYHLFALLALVLMMAGPAPARADDLDIDLKVDGLHQNDYPDKLDNSDLTIASDGCSLTAWAMAINAAIAKEGLHDKTADGKEGALIKYTPADLNRLLNDYRYTQTHYKKGADGKVEKGPDGKPIVTGTTTHNGWGVEIGADGKPVGSATEISIGALRKAIEADIKARSFEGKTLKMDKFTASGWGATPELPAAGTTPDKVPAILEQLKNGIPVVVRVANDTHTVLINSYHGPADGSGRYDIKDPFKNGDGSSIIWLDDPAYKNTIFAYNASVFKSGGIQPQPFQTPNDMFLPDELLFNPEFNPDLSGPQYFDPNTARVLDVPEPTTTVLALALLVGGLSLIARHRQAATLRRRAVG